jgi:general secretion pathway protein F
MALFAYKAAAADGQLLEGRMEAVDRDAVVQRLQSQGHVPIRAEEVAPAPLAGSSRVSLAMSRRGVRVDVQVLTTELSTLLNAGLPLDRALELLRDLSATDSEARRLLDDLHRRVRGGADLSAALGEHPAVFSSFYINMVRAGEASGALDVVTARLAEFLERSRAVRDTVVSATIYPAILLVVAMLSLSLILAVVVPRISQMFEDAGEALPWYTQLVVGAGALVEQYWWLGLGVTVAAALWLRADYATPVGRLRWDRLALRVPWIGDLVQKVEAARFSRSLGTMLGNGVGLLDAVAISGAIVSNAVLADGVRRAAISIREGGGVAAPLLREAVLPTMAIKLIRVGEESGHLEQMLLKVADIYEREVDNTIRRLIAVLAPALVLVLAGLILGIMVSLVMPIIMLNQLAV